MGTPPTKGGAQLGGWMRHVSRFADFQTACLEPHKPTRQARAALELAIAIMVPSKKCPAIESRAVGSVYPAGGLSAEQMLTTWADKTASKSQRVLK